MLSDIRVSHAPATASVEGVVGPNAILQLAAALRLVGGQFLEREIFRTAGLEEYLVRPPDAMASERRAARLFDTVDRLLPQEAALQVMTMAGERTAAYILAHRIPAPAKRLLAHLPRWLAARLLLMAIGKHAWTFCGSGRVTCDYGTAPGLTLLSNPLARPGCPWHVAVLSGLFREIVSPRCRVQYMPVGIDDGRNARFAILFS